jgi:predicted DNA binding CopG/RHH family protein
MSELTPEEKAVLDAFEAGELEPIDDVERENERYRSYAANALKRDQRISIRISSGDLAAIQERAQEAGMPYQALIEELLHKYAASAQGGSGT